MHDSTHIFEALRAKGTRITSARKAIIAALSSEEKPLSAADIYALLLKQKSKADKVTVYRELEFLQKENMVMCVQFQDRNRRYELTSLKHHHHLICQKCEQIEDIHIDEDFESQKKVIAKKMKFKVISHSLEFFGLCQACQ